MNIAIIDLGSNSFHLVIYAAKSRDEYAVVERVNYLTHLGAYLTEHETIPGEHIQTCATRVSELVQIARDYKCKSVHLFGTGIFRNAPNSDKLYDTIRLEAGCDIDVLSSSEEATLIFNAVQQRHALEKRSLIVDIGGGSSEFIIAQENQMEWFASVPFGTGFMAHTIRKATTHAERLQVVADACLKMADVVSVVGKEPFHACYGTSGFLRCIALWLHGPDSILEKKEVLLKRADIEKVARELSENVGAYNDEEKGGIVLAGALMFLSLLSSKTIPEITVSALSTREGYLLKVLGKT